MKQEFASQTYDWRIRVVGGVEFIGDGALGRVGAELQAIQRSSSVSAAFRAANSASNFWTAARRSRVSGARPSFSCQVMRDLTWGLDP
jgi:hypothetical protein